MDLKPLLGFDMGNQNQFLEWVYAGETHMDSPFVSKISNTFPVTLPDVLNSYSSNEPTSIFSTNNAFYDPMTTTFNPNHGFNMMIETDHQPPLQDLEILDDFYLDFLKFDHYTTYPHENEIPTVYNPQDVTMKADRPEHYPQVQIEGNGSNQQGSYGETESVGHGGYRSNRLTKSSSIGFGEISKYFYMTITDAAKEMNVGLTVLKKRCRELGISRWPHRKMKSLKSLIHNVQELGKGTADEEVQREIQTLEESKRLMEQMPELKLSDRTKKLRQACFKANYKRRRAMQVSPSPYRSRMMTK